MKPVLLHGRSTWDQHYFPLDECEERLRLVRAEMTHRGLKCLVVFGHSSDYEDLCYLTQYIPMVGWSMVVVPADGIPILVPGLGGGRDIPSVRARSWISDVRGLRSLGDGLAELLAELRITSGIGLIGADRCLPATLHDEVLDAIGEDRLVQASDVLGGLRRSLRPREISAVRQAARIVREAAIAFTAAVGRGDGNAAAMVEADGAARKLGAHDFRGLVDLSEGGFLEPVTELTPFRSETVTAYLAASFLGYWADLAITTGITDYPVVGEVREALGAMVGCARPGMKVGDVAEQALGKLGARYALAVGERGFGWSLGLTLQGKPHVAKGSDETLVENSVLSLQIRTDGHTNPGAVLSDLVLIKADGCESLFQSGSQLNL